MNSTSYKQIVAHYEACLDRHGDNHRGVDWPNAADADRRYGVMLDVIRADNTRPVELLDLGCGAAHLLDYLGSSGRRDVVYTGLDLSSKFVELARQKHPGVRFLCADVLEDAAALPEVDYVVMNGVFTEKLSLSYDEMFEYLGEMLRRVFPMARRGMALNLMSAHVDWQRDDLFHVPLDALAARLRSQISRHYLFRARLRLVRIHSLYVYR